MSRILLGKEDIYRGDLVLVNRDYRYHEQHQDLSLVGSWNGEDSYVSHAGAWKGEVVLYEHIFLQSRANHALNQLMDEIGGWAHIVPVSAWRSLSEQQAIWDQSLSESGQEFTERFVAVPGHSEHQTGLAIDLGLRQEEIDFIRPYFPYEGICQAFRERAAAYGFIERYQKEKQAVTRIGHEPWHFRYVGTPHAEIMVQKGFALEEYIRFIRDYRYGENPLVFQQFEISYLEAADLSVSDAEKANAKESDAKVVNAKASDWKASDAEAMGINAKNDGIEIEIDDTGFYRISGDNCGGFIVTQISRTGCGIVGEGENEG